MTDLYLSKKELLYRYIKEKRYVKTSEVIRFGLDNYSTRADRDARQLAKEGRIRRVPERFKLMMFGQVKEDIWEVNASLKSGQ